MKCSIIYRAISSIKYIFKIQSTKFFIYFP